MTLRQYWPPNFSVCRPRVQLTASSNCQTLSSKLVVLSWVPRFDRAELEKLRPSSPSRPDGLPLPMPIVLPNCPTPEAQLVPLPNVTRSEERRVGKEGRAR